MKENDIRVKGYKNDDDDEECERVNKKKIEKMDSFEEGWSVCSSMLE